MRFIASAPAKIILTGEHSVVYGKPCIVTAINRFAHATIVPTLSRDICLSLFDFKQKASLTMKALTRLRERLLESYRLCIKGELSIRDVLHKPAELLQFSIICLMDLFQMELQNGFRVDVRSEIPIGCGMGSSAATIVSVIGAVAHYLKIEINTEWLHSLSVEAEKLQHGFSSGVDSYVSLHGGCVKFQNGKAEQLASPPFPLYIINTGKPETSTGDSVMMVAKKHKTSTIWSEFDAIAIALQEALIQANFQKIKECLFHNHSLLNSIGVVPKKACDFIQRLYQQGISAKICGAGATHGDACGVILASSMPSLELCNEFGYTMIAATPESEGVRFA